MWTKNCSNKRVVITGGAGFIGSHLVDVLMKNSCEVIVIDNLGTGRIENIKQHMDKKGFTFIKHDVTNPIKIDGHIDEIYHLASRASPKDYVNYPVETALANSVGTWNMLEIAREKDAKILFASTSEAYGEPLVHPQNEEYRGNVSSTGIRSCYDESKRFGEALMMAYHRQYGLQTRIVRIFNTYGPRMRVDDGRVIPTFIVQALKNEDITINGDGTQTRSFCYVSDTVRGIIMLMDSNYIEPKNIGNPKETSILELAHLIKKLTGSRSRFRHLPLPPDDPTKRQPDISKARKLLGWKPEVDLVDGLKITIDWIKKEIGME